MRRRWQIVRWLAVAAACAPAACSTKEEPGLKVTVDLAAFAGMVETMQVVIGADPGGFEAYTGPNVKNVGVKTEDFDGNTTLELILTFVQPDTTESFRVETGNRAALTMNAQAMAFGADDIIASAMGEPKSLSPGGESEIPLSLTAAGMNPINAHTRTTDLGTATTDVTIQGAQPTASIAALAVCDVDGDMNEDIIIGTPGDMSNNLGATGAVTIVWGAWPSDMTTTVDLAKQDQPNLETHFYGEASAAQLGAAVACVDLNGDGFDDVVVGSPGMDGGRGRIYVVFGQQSFQSSRPVDLTSATTGAEIVWTTNTAGAQLGKTLFATSRRTGIAPYILAAAPGAKVTHLFAGVKPGMNGPEQLDADGAAHPTFTGIAAAAIAAGDLDGNAVSSKKLDVALADPTYRDVNDAAMGRGRVYLFADVDPAATAPIDVAAAHPTVTGTAPNSHLGTAVLLADTTGQGDDLFIGAPFDADTGVVYLFPNNPNIFLPPELMIDTTTANIAGYDTGGFYGAALASTRPGSPTGALRLVVGAPNVSRPGRTGVGAAYLYNTSSDRRFRIYDQIYGKDAGDALGTVVAGGQLNLATDSVGDLVAAAPNAAGSVSGTGVVYVRYGK